MAQINHTPIQSYTGALGNTWYWGGAGATSDDGTRAGGLGAIALDVGSDGGLDAGFIAGAAAGPNGAAGGILGTGRGGWRGEAAAINANGELTNRWSKFLPY